MKKESCVLCGSLKSHPCGDDYMCDRCCNNIMATTDLRIEKWLDTVVIPRAIKVKKENRQIKIGIVLTVIIVAIPTLTATAFYLSKFITPLLQ